MEGEYCVEQNEGSDSEEEDIATRQQELERQLTSHMPSFEENKSNYPITPQKHNHPTTFDCSMDSQPNEGSDSDDEDELAREQLLQRELRDDMPSFEESGSTYSTTPYSQSILDPSPALSPNKGHNVQYFHGLIPESRNVNGELESDVFAGTSQARETHHHENGILQNGSGDLDGYHGNNGFAAHDQFMMNSVKEMEIEKVVDQDFLSLMKPLPCHPPQTEPLPQSHLPEEYNIQGIQDPQLRPHPSSQRYAMEQLQDSPSSSQVYDARPLPLPHPPPPSQGYSVEELEILYHGKERQVKELTQQLSVAKQDTELHIRLLRGNIESLTVERDQLTQQCESLQRGQEELDKEMSSLRGELRAEKTRSETAETGKAKVMAELVSAEATIHSLNQQVRELSSTEYLTRERASYTTRLQDLSQQYNTDLAALQGQLTTAREEGEEKDTMIAKLTQELNDLRTQSSQQPAVAPDHTHSSQKRQDTTLAQQLSFAGAERGEDGGEEEGEGGVTGNRLVELATQVEDLKFQVSSLTEQLEKAVAQTNDAESAVVVLRAELLESEAGRAMLQEELTRLHAVLQDAESEKKEALEQCRKVCLKLHEEASQRLRTALTEERDTITNQLTQQLAQEKMEVCTVKEEYVQVCEEKRKLNCELDAVRAELGRLREESASLRIRVREEGTSLTTELDRVKGERTSLKTELDRVKEENTSLKMELDRVKEKRTSMGTEFDGAKDKGISLKTELDRVREERTSLKAELDRMKEERTSMRTEFDRAKDKGISLKAELDSVVEERDSLKAELDSVVEERDSMKEGLSALKMELDLLQEERASLRAERDSLKGERRALKDKRDSASQDGREGEVAGERDARPVERLKDKFAGHKTGNGKQFSDKCVQTEGGSEDHAPNGSRATRVGVWPGCGRGECEEEKRRSVEEAVKGARIQWLQERERILQSRIELAVSAAHKCWQRDHRNQLHSQQPPPHPLLQNSAFSSPLGLGEKGGVAKAKEHVADDKEVVPKGVASGDDPNKGVGVSKETEATKGVESRGVVTEMEVRHEQELRDAVAATRKACETAFAGQLATVVARERESWLQEERKAWHQRREELLAAAHRHWSLQQEGVWQAKLEEGKKEAEVRTREKVESAVLLALSECKKSYEKRFEELRHQLQKQHCKEKELLTQQVVQLEAQLVDCLRERDNGGGGGVCGMGGPDMDAALRAVSDSLRSDVMALIKEVLEKNAASQERRLREVKLATARSVIAHYSELLQPLLRGGTTSLSHGADMAPSIPARSRDDAMAPPLHLTWSHDTVRTSHDTGRKHDNSKRSHDTKRKSQDSARGSHDIVRSQDTARASHDFHDSGSHDPKRSHDSAKASRDTVRSHNTAKASHDPARASRHDFEWSHDSRSHAARGLHDIERSHDFEWSHDTKKSHDSARASHDTVRSHDPARASHDMGRSHDPAGASHDFEWSYDLVSHDTKKSHDSARGSHDLGRLPPHAATMPSLDSVVVSHDAPRLSHDNVKESHDTKQIPNAATTKRGPPSATKSHDIKRKSEKKSHDSRKKLHDNAKKSRHDIRGKSHDSKEKSHNAKKHSVVSARPPDRH